MYDVDGNGWIDLSEMTGIVISIYKMMGEKVYTNQRSNYSDNIFFICQDEEKNRMSAEERAVSIFQKMDINNDGRVTRQEFVRTCLNDQKLLKLLTPNTE